MSQPPAHCAGHIEHFLGRFGICSDIHILIRHAVFLKKGLCHNAVRAVICGVDSNFAYHSDDHPVPLVQQTLHLFRIISEDKLIFNLDYGDPKAPGFLEDHISRFLIGRDIDLIEFNIMRPEELLDLMTVMARRG